MDPWMYKVSIKMKLCKSAYELINGSRDEGKYYIYPESNLFLQVFRAVLTETISYLNLFAASFQGLIQLACSTGYLMFVTGLQVDY